VRTMVIVVVLPLAQLLVEEMDVVRDPLLVQELVELLRINPMGSFDFAVEARRPWTNVHMSDVSRLQMPMKLRLELRPVVGLDDEHAEG
jgi:hypothetical protein